jgi:hypothetical protein
MTLLPWMSPLRGVLHFITTLFHAHPLPPTQEAIIITALPTLHTLLTEFGISWAMDCWISWQLQSPSCISTPPIACQCLS